MIELDDDQLAQKVNRNQDKFDVFISRTPGDAVGARVIANKAMPAGHLILKELPFGWVVSETEIDSACAGCGKSFLLDFEGNCIFEADSCKRCKGVYFCSLACRNSVNYVHSLECSVLPKLQEIADRANVDCTLVRAGLACLLQVNAEVMKEEGDQDGSTDETSFRSTFLDCGKMVSHSSTIDLNHRLQMQAAAEQVVSLLPSVVEAHGGADVAATRMIDFMCMINANAHQLSHGDGNEMRLPMGLGLYPLLSKFNHSCYPNCVFANMGNVVALRTIRPVKKGEELCVNYVDLYQTVWTRREELLESKKFWCQCLRCLLRPSSEEEKEHFCVDEEVQGVRCLDPDCQSKHPATSKVSKSVPNVYQPLLEKKKKKKKKKKGPTADSVASQPEPSAPSDVSPSKGSDNEEWVCGACGDRKTVEALKSSVIAPAKMACDQAFENYTSNQTRPDQKKVALENALETLTNTLHPNHELIFHLLSPLINCCRVVGDVRAALEYSRKALAMAEGVFPDNFLGKCRYLCQHADMLTAFLSAAASVSHFPKMMINKLSNERKEILTRNYEIKTICCGEDHPYTTTARERLQKER